MFFSYTMTSSLIFKVPGMSRSWSLMMFWKVSLAEFVPKLSRVYRRRPLCVTKVVTVSVQWNLVVPSFQVKLPLLHSDCEQDRLPWGWGVSLRMALFGILISTHRRTLPFFFGAMTRGETHVVGPSTFSIIP